MIQDPYPLGFSIRRLLALDPRAAFSFNMEKH